MSDPTVQGFHRSYRNNLGGFPVRWTRHEVLYSGSHAVEDNARDTNFLTIFVSWQRAR